MSNKKISTAIVSALLLVGLLAWLFVESTKPLPGTKIADLGRGHVPIGEEVTYNSNPPTSGKHYEEWVKSGVYKEARDDRSLVHSLEHGYVILSYNCDKQISLIPQALAHGIEAEDSTSSATLSDNFRSDECHKLVDKLTSIYEKKGKTRLIVIPRPVLDTRIALTAWNYLDKFNEFDQNRIEKFIDVHINQGPEKTME